MNHGLMSGMFWGGVLISAIPVLASIGMALFIWRQSRNERAVQQAEAGTTEEVTS